MPVSEAGDDIVDLLVVGGGINGAGIARDAAGRGLQRALSSRAISPSATSSAIDQAHPWRPALSRILRVPPGARGAGRARGAARGGAAHHPPARFVLPHHKAPAAGLADPARPVPLRPSRRPRSACRPTRSLDLAPRSGGPAAEARILVAASSYSDCWVDDARLVVLNAIDARERGASILTRTSCIAAERDGDRLDADGRRTR